jgi:cyclopropane fatty-acyl-phospholipid synthase-like methyltransferase
MPDDIKNWFKEWFNTVDYHLLYSHRDFEEAGVIIDHVSELLQLAKGSRVVDLACGRGRHSVALHRKGFKVCGLDLSEQNITYANQYFLNRDLDFFQHDMRDSFPVKDMDAVFNFFTSFGYFDTIQEHVTVIKNVHDCLKQGGYFILDYFNADRVRHDLVAKEERAIEDKVFQIKRYLDHSKIVKEIKVTSHGPTRIYYERVEAFSSDDLKHIFELGGLEVVDIFGDYTLNPYQKDTSPRMIMVGRRTT